MITKNLISLMSSIFSSESGFKLKNLQGSELTWANRQFYNMFTSDLQYKDYSNMTDDNLGIYLLLGTGAATATSDDYKLDSIESNYTVIAQNHTVFTNTYGNQILVINRIIQNTSSSAITINELGLCGWQIMIAREVLDEPVTLQPGEKHTFTMTIGLE